MSHPAPDGFFMITHANMEKLDGAGLLAMGVYMVLASVTDTKTGIAGNRSGISRQMLRERTERLIRRGLGFQTAYRATDNELRRALQELERRLLIERIGSAECLVFRMAGMKHESVRPKRTEPGSDIGAIPANRQYLRGVEGHREPVIEPVIEPSSRIPTTSILKTSSHPDTSSKAETTREDIEQAQDGLMNDPFVGLPPVPDNTADFVKAIKRLGWSTNGVYGAEANAILNGFVAEGVSLSILVRANVIARSKGGKSALYLLKTAKTLVEGETELAAAQPSAMDMLGFGRPWHQRWTGIVAKGRELGLAQGTDELPGVFRNRVFNAAGLSRKEFERWKVCA